jgi:hypothetical protein
MTKTLDVASITSVHFSLKDMWTFKPCCCNWNIGKEIPNRVFKRILKRAMDLDISDIVMQHDRHLYVTGKR